MLIRPVQVSDLNQCIAIDDSFQTDYVWQMEEQSNPRSIDIKLRLMHLPRPMKVTGAVSYDDLLQNLTNGDAIFVADDGGVCGFIDLSPRAWNYTVYVNNILVDPALRRRGIGGRLLRAGLEWARIQGLRVAMLDTSTKNYPAICFYEKNGFSFCGFNDRFYPSRDIAMFFSQNLR